MPNEPQATPETAARIETVPPSQKPIAPVWHTVLIAGLLLANSFLGSSQSHRLSSDKFRILVYTGTFVFELALFALVWLGVRRRLTMRDLIGGRWKSVEDFLLDVAIAAGFFLVASAINIGTRVALGVLDLHNVNQQAAEVKRTLGPLIPKSGLEVSLFVALSVFAGLFEEIIFRGYLQRQIGAVARNVWAGIVGSAIIFGAAHGYQGNRMMIVIGIYGALFGILAYLRKSLRPGMMAHAFQDAYSGIGLYFLTKKGIF